MEEDLRNIIEGSDVEIMFYLENTSIEQFKKDVISLMESSSDKYYINQAIEKLKQLL